MLQCFIKLAELVMLHTSVVVVKSQCLLRLIFILRDLDSNREVVQRSLKISHQVVALASVIECFGMLSVIVAQSGQKSEGFLDVLLVFLIDQFVALFNYLFGIFTAIAPSVHVLNSGFLGSSRCIFSFRSFIHICLNFYSYYKFFVF